MTRYDIYDYGTLRPANDGELVYFDDIEELLNLTKAMIDLSKSPREHKEARERASKLLAELENNNA